ncbi:olfactory receptor-like protein OLF4 [Polypterus senegalus]|uniref:olfactory receptor-like protein OLF4 n=1 Tax=Polypterus senegalus TaxID=55291 RepID=UPI001964AE11|nr:olfactory receptor-like protein OLF4 [Polypterus senegalus]
MNQSNQIVHEFIMVGFPGIQDRYSKNILFGVLLLVYLCIVLGNLLIMFAYLSDQTMHTPMYMLIFSLALLDLMSSTTTVPKLLSILTLESAMISITACFTQMFLYGILKAAESFLLGLMAYDRYLAICKPLHYFRITNNNLVWKLIFCCWAIAFCVVVTPVTLTVKLPFCGPNKLVHFFCEHSTVIKLACGDHLISTYTGLIVSLLVMVAPLFYVVYSYIKILKSVFKIESSHGRLKALSTCSSHLLVLSVFYLIGSGVLILSKIPNSPVDVHIMAALLQNVTPPLVNPIIYCLNTKEMKARFMKLLTLKRISPHRH